MVATPRGAVRKRFGSQGLATSGISSFTEPAVTDKFNRADGDPGANWTAWSGLNKPKIKSEKLESQSPNQTMRAYWNVAEQANPAVMVNLTELPNSESSVALYLYVAAKAESSITGNFVRLSWSAGSTYRLEVGIAVEGTHEFLASVFVELAPFDKLAISVRGELIVAWVKHSGVWSRAVEVKKAGIRTTGVCGVGIDYKAGVKWVIDDFAMGEQPAGGLPAEEVQSLFRVEPEGTPYLIAAVGKKLYSINAAGEVTVIKEGLTESAANKWACVQSVKGTREVLGPVFLSNGVDPPQAWTGAAKGTLTVEWKGKKEGEFVEVPKAKYLVYAGNRVWAAGMTGKEVCAVRYSGFASAGAEGNTADPTNWPKENIIYFDTADSTPITGLGVYGPYVLVFKKRSTYVIYDLNEGENRRISDSIGCAAYRSIVETSIGTFFLTPDQGIYLTNGSSVREVSRNVRPAFQGLDSETSRSLRGSEIERSAAGFLNGHYYLSYRAEDGTVKTFDYDTVLQSWWLHDLGGNQWATWEPTVNIQSLYTCPKGTTLGVVRAWISNVYTDSGVNYTGAKSLTCYWSSAWEPFFQYVLRHRINQPQVRKRIRTLFVDGKGQLITLVSRKFGGALEELRGVVDSEDESMPGSPLTLGTESNETQAARYYSLGVSRVWSFTFGNNSSLGLEVDTYACDLSFRKS